VNIICLNTDKFNTTAAVQQFLKYRFPESNCLLCTSLEDLEIALRTPHHHPDIAILAVRTQKEMTHLIRMTSLLEDVKILLFLQDADQALKDMSYKLFPRFIADETIRSDELMRIIKGLAETVENKAPVAMHG